MRKCNTSQRTNNITCILYLDMLVKKKHNFLQPADYFQKVILQTLSKYHTVLDQDQVKGLVGPNLGPNCLLRLSADVTSKRKS